MARSLQIHRSRCFGLKCQKVREKTRSDHFEICKKPPVFNQRLFRNIYYKLYVSIRVNNTEVQKVLNLHPLVMQKIPQYIICFNNNHSIPLRTIMSKPYRFRLIPFINLKESSNLKSHY